MRRLQMGAQRAERVTEPAQARGNSSVAIGVRSIAGIDNSVALGNQSQTQAVTTTTVETTVEVAQLAAVAMTADMPVDDVARIAVSFPTYAEVLVHAAILATMELGLPLSGQEERVRRDLLPT